MLGAANHIRCSRGAPVPVCVTAVQRRWINEKLCLFAGLVGWKLPRNPITTKEEQKNLKFDVKSRQKWDYKAIDEMLTSRSEFSRMDNRPFFDGPRPAPHTADPHQLRGAKATQLHEWFDEYTRGDPNVKGTAAKAAQEHWDAKEMYYPGEVWQRNRPAFRGVPIEQLNDETYYESIRSAYEKQPKIMSASRPRTWVPRWPPPGYKMPKFVTKREFVYGVDEPGLVTEVERWFWFRNWHESNLRTGMGTFACMFFSIFVFYYVSRVTHSPFLPRMVMGNMWYPGRRALRMIGEPNDPNTECFWWQKPLDEFPNQSEIWYVNEIRYGYINYLKRREEQRKMEAAL